MKNRLETSQAEFSACKVVFTLVNTTDSSVEIRLRSPVV